jgi:WD40 repeat protein
MTTKNETIINTYISAGCNKCPKALDWGGNQNQLLTCVSNSVALYSNDEPFEIKCTFNKHTDRVNCVKWLSSNDLINWNLFRANEFISASKDKTIIVWQGQNFQV